MATVKKKNKTLRVVVPLIVLAAAALFVIGSYTNPKRGQQNPADEQAVSQETPENTQLAQERAGSGEESAGDEPPAQVEPIGAEESSADPVDSTDEPGEELAGADTATEPEPEPEPAIGSGEIYRVQPLYDGTPFTPLGSLDPSSGYKLEFEASRYGAGLREVVLSDFWKTVKKEERYALVEEQTIQLKVKVGFTPMAATYLKINDADLISLYSRFREGLPAATDIWREVEPGRYEALIIDSNDQEVLRLERQYTVEPGSYEITLEQRFENLTDAPMELALFQFGPADPTEGTGTYGGDRRRVRFGYLKDAAHDPTRTNVLADKFLIDRMKFPKKKDRLWPNKISEAEGYSLSYVAMTNRYFALAAYEPVTDDPNQIREFSLVQSVYPQVFVNPTNTKENAMALEMHLQPQRLAPGASETLTMSIFAGPLEPSLLEAAGSPYAKVGLDKLIVYRFGCTWCTFQWLAHVLLWFLGLLHNYVLFDWALAIMALVAVVRGLLHPLTKKAQVNMSMFSKQMQSLKPKMDKVKEKFADEPKRQQVEMQRLMREEGMNPANMLGCLPMFLQMPIWIALYAMLFYAMGLRQESAFFGVFQQFGGWQFMADLSLPDRFWQFSGHINIPLMGQVSSINILPLLMGIIFFVQQKYLTPATGAAMTKEQETQQKIMKIMMVVMFPVFLYNAPSGLTLYILTSSSVSIMESRYIRSHINELDVEEFMQAKKRKKGKGMMARMQEERQRKQRYTPTPKRAGKKRK
jgi:YidC/Oxa1 family membrane protein insertase